MQSKREIFLLPPKPLWWKTLLLAIVATPVIGFLSAVILLWNQYVFLPDVMWFVVMYMLTGIGITVGYHRMLTHRSFKPHPVVKFFLLVFASMAVEGSAIEWVATHLLHHALSDKEGDPHSPMEGFFHSHVGWLFKDKQADPHTYCSYLYQDKIVMFVSRTFLFWVFLGMFLPFVFDGWRGLLWGGLVRLFLTQHVTWSVNSVCHTFGKREFETKDRSKNQWIVGLFGFGEGWHNNHHAFQRSAFHGLHWWQIDISGYIIWGLEKLGLAKDVYRVSEEEIQKRKERKHIPDGAGIS